MHRRDAIRGLAAAGALASGGFGEFGSSAAAEQGPETDTVRFGPDIEPLVRLIEDTPREDCIEVVAARVRSGLAYRDLLTALFLAGIRNVSPQPPGFKLHCVFVLHSANQLSLDVPVNERLLPLLWALDYFKQSQELDAEEEDFRLQNVQGRLPSASEAWGELDAAMESWDAERADRAITVLARERGGHEVIEGLWRYGARDYRNIGHKAIFTANAWRTLQTIGWRHAEPALRSLTMGLLDFGPDLRMNGYAFADQSHAANAETARKVFPDLPSGWIAGRIVDPAAAGDILATIRKAAPAESGTAVARLLAGGKLTAREAWEGILLRASELMLSLPGILGVHCITSANALHYAFRMSARAETRLYLLLQGVGWMSQFAHFMSREDGFRTLDITRLDHDEVPKDAKDAATDVLATLADDRDEAARKAFGYGMTHRDTGPLFQMARRALLRKVEESHHFKFAAAIFEDIALTSPARRPHLLAAATHYLRGTGDPDSEIVERARRALKIA